MVRDEALRPSAPDGAPRPDRAPTSIPDLVHAMAAATPDAVAVASPARALTYRELDARSGLIARELGALGIAPGATVALVTPSSPEMVAGALGILAAGAAYLPLDPGGPAERIAFMLADSGC